MGGLEGRGSLTEALPAGAPGPATCVGALSHA